MVAAARRERACRRGRDGAARARPLGDGARALDAGCRAARRSAGVPGPRAAARRRRGRAGGPDLAALADGRPGRRSREPAARARARPLRRRPRLRARAPLALLSRAARDGRAHGRHVLLDRSARLPAGTVAAREAARRASTRCVALSEPIRDAAAERFPGDYRIISPGVDLDLFRPAAKRKQITVELRPNERAGARSVLRALRELPGWEAVLLRTTPLVGRPAIPRDLADRVHVRTARDGRRPRGDPRRDGDLRPRDRGLARGAARGAGRRLRDRRAGRRRGAAGARGGSRGSPRRETTSCARASRTVLRARRQRAVVRGRRRGARRPLHAA